MGVIQLCCSQVAPEEQQDPDLQHSGLRKKRSGSGRLGSATWTDHLSHSSRERASSGRSSGEAASTDGNGEESKLIWKLCNAIAPGAVWFPRCVRSEGNLHPNPLGYVLQIRTFAPFLWPPNHNLGLVPGMTLLINCLRWTSCRLNWQSLPPDNVPSTKPKHLFIQQTFTVHLHVLGPMLGGEQTTLITVSNKKENHECIYFWNILYFQGHESIHEKLFY